jgi:hypothetical protein
MERESEDLSFAISNPNRPVNIVYAIYNNVAIHLT